MVLHFCKEDHVVFTNKFSAPCLSHQIDALGGSAREDDFVRARRADVFRNALPGPFVSFSRARAQSMQPTMNIRIFMLVKMLKRLDHRPRFLGGCRAIKIDQRMAMRLFAENREIYAKSLPTD